MKMSRGHFKEKITIYVSILQIKTIFYICPDDTFMQVLASNSLCDVLLCFSYAEEQKERENYVIALDNIGRRRAILRLLYN